MTTRQRIEGAPGGALSARRRTGSAGHAPGASRDAGGVFARALLGGLLVLLAVLPAACSTARERDTPRGVGSLLQYRDAETAHYFEHVYRSGNLYVDFRPALIVDAIVQDRKYRELYVSMLRKQFLLGDAEAQRLAAEQTREFDGEVGILLFTYEGDNTATRLTRGDAAWKLYLRDDDGQLLQPTAVTRIGEDTPIYQYIDKYFSGLDRWTRVYRLSFPKLSKVALNQPMGANPFELIVTGVKGTVTLKWEDPRIFYGTDDAAAGTATRVSN